MAFLSDIEIAQATKLKHIREIAEKLLGEVGKRTAEMEINIEFSDSAADKIADVGFDEIYGARPLRRAVRSNVEDKLSELLLEGEIKAGKNYICDVKDGEFVFTEKTA